MISEKELEMVIEVLQDCSEYIEKDLGHLRAELTSRLLQVNELYCQLNGQVMYLFKIPDLAASLLFSSTRERIPTSAIYSGHVTTTGTETAG